MLGLALIYFLPEMWILVYNLWLLIKVILYDKLLFLLECVNLQCIWNLWYAKHSYEYPWKNWKFLYPLWIFLQPAEIFKMFLGSSLLKFKAEKQLNTFN